MSSPLRDTAVWREALGIPDALERTGSEAAGFDEVVALMRGARRVVATGNGASYYAALALWLVSLEDEVPPVDVVAVPAGLLATGDFVWRRGDLLLAISSSGELRDVLTALDAGAPRPYASVTANAESSIGRGAGAAALVHVETQDAAMHTQGFTGAVLVTLALWARLCNDGRIDEAVHEAPGLVVDQLARAEAWAAAAADGVGRPSAAIAVGSGYAWPAALEAALLLEELAVVPSEGLETREGATTGMYALGAGQLVLALPSRPTTLLEEAERVWRARGADVLHAPDGELGDPLVAPLTTFPAVLALAATLGLRAGLDVDRPAWVDAYYETTRRPSA